MRRSSFPFAGSRSGRNVAPGGPALKAPEESSQATDSLEAALIPVREDEVVSGGVALIAVARIVHWPVVEARAIAPGRNASRTVLGNVLFVVVSTLQSAGTTDQLEAAGSNTVNGVAFPRRQRYTPRNAGAPTSLACPE